MNVRYLRMLLIFIMFLLINTSLPAQKHSSVPLRWPQPPEKTRIEFLYAFSGTNDLGIEKPWWKKLIDFVLGEDDEVIQLNRPQAVAVNSKGDIYVSDPPVGRIHKFNFSERKYSAIKKTTQADIISPVGIAIGQNDWVFVVDSELKKVNVFDQNEKYLYSFPTIFKRPTGILIKGERIYIIDTGVHQIIVCDFSGKEQYRFGKRGNEQAQFNYPIALCMNNTAEQHLAILDALNFRVQLLSSNGEYKSEFGRMGDSPGDFGRPKCIATDSEGHYYITDALYDVIQIFNKNGEILMAFGGSGSTLGKFSLPAGLSIDSNNRIYVVDSGNQRIQVFQYVK